MNDSLASTLVLCDLDNLLLGEDGNLTQVVRDVLQLFSSRGGRLTVFSQRSPRAVRSILGSVRLAAPALVCGGTMAYHYADGNRVPLCSFAQQQELFNCLPDTPGVGVAVQMQDGTTRVLRMSNALERHLRQEWTPYLLANAADIHPEQVLRVLLYQDSKSVPLISLAEKAIGDRVALLGERIAPDTLVLTPKRISGREMLDTVCTMAQVGAEQVLVLAGSQPMLELVFSVLFPAVGSAILFNIQGSTGGTDIVAMIFKKFTSLDIGKALFCTDFIIATLAGVVFGIETGLFSLLGLLAKALVVDSVIESINMSKYFTIVTHNPDEVIAYIKKELNRSATLVTGEGAYYIGCLYALLKKFRNHFTVQIDDGEKITQDCLFCFAGNSRWYGGGFMAGPKAYPDDGLLDFIIVESKLSRLKLATLLNKYKRGEHLDWDITNFQRGKKLVIHSDHPAAVNVDGETKYVTDTSFEIVEKGIVFVVPAGSPFLKDRERRLAAGEIK